MERKHEKMFTVRTELTDNPRVVLKGTWKEQSGILGTMSAPVEQCEMRTFRTIHASALAPHFQVAMVVSDPFPKLFPARKWPVLRP
jgi:hypothetical protein